MSSSPLDRFYETVLIPPTPGEVHYVEGCVPDLYFSVFGDIDLNQVAALGVHHILVDVDGTIAAKNGRHLSVTASTAQKLKEIQEDSRFKSLSLATENLADSGYLLSSLGIAAVSKVFQPWEVSNLGMSWKTTERYWRRILYEIDCPSKPSKAVVIGDSLARDIQPAQALGLKTVLVDRLERRLRPASQLGID